MIASSEKEFDDAAATVVIDETSRTVRGIHGREITGFNVKISDDKPVEFRTACKVAFEVEYTAMKQCLSFLFILFLS